MATITITQRLSILFLVVALQSCAAKDFSLGTSKIKREQLPKWRTFGSFAAQTSESDTFAAQLPVFISPQDGLKEKDKIESLPGQPEGVNFNQYAGYVTVDPNAGRALFYYFVESPENASSKAFVLWLNHSPYCSSLGNGAFTELGPFRVQKDGKTLYQNQYAWNREANIIFLESPAGAGFSYSNTSWDYEHSSEHKTARDTYTFLINWLERFPHYKTRDFFIAGERYVGHFATQLARLIHHYGKKKNHTTVNLRRIIVGNPIIDDVSISIGNLDYYWSHALISDEIYIGIKSNCNFSSPTSALSDTCIKYYEEFNKVTENINPNDIYAPLCNSTFASNSISDFDPCTPDYVFNYLNNPQVQIAFHVDAAIIPHHWELCNYTLRQHWNVNPLSVLPMISKLMNHGIQIWLYSGDTDGDVTITSTRYAINKLRLPVKTRWYPWYFQNEVGGYVVEYENLTFVTVRGTGHLVPSYQPAKAVALFSSFINGELPPSS